ncbi:MAG: hypothetical protein HQL48_07465 [Gammaproteobacteria bacterium]|nr:hypothetical protein [Gammaproteobacteria bacterium]
MTQEIIAASPAQNSDNSALNPSDNQSQGYNPFDPSALKLSQNYTPMSGVKKVLNTVPVRKPGKQDYFRTHPDPQYRLETMVLELKEERETYLVAQKLWQELPGELTPKALVLAINRQKVVMLWPIGLPGEDGKMNPWHEAAAEAAEMAKEKWMRMSANMALGAYDIFEATGELPEPEWPKLSMMEILRIAFKGRYIDSFDHAVIQRLQGKE